MRGCGRGLLSSMKVHIPVRIATIDRTQSRSDHDLAAAAAADSRCATVEARRLCGPEIDNSLKVFGILKEEECWQSSSWSLNIGNEGHEILYSACGNVNVVLASTSLCLVHVNMKMVSALVISSLIRRWSTLPSFFHNSFSASSQPSSHFPCSSFVSCIAY